MPSRRRYLGAVASATLLAAGCLGDHTDRDATPPPGSGDGSVDDPARGDGADGSRSDGTDEELAPPPADTDPVAQFQYDAANAGRVDAAVPDDPDVRWRTHVASSEAGLAAGGDRVVVATGGLTALEVDEGAEHWSTSIDGWIDAPPALSADTAYVATWGPMPAHGVVAVSLGDGRPRWRAGATLEAATAPTLADGAVYVGGSLDDDRVTAFDARTGEALWRTRIGEYATTPAVADGSVYVGGGDTHAVVALEAADGDERWRAETDGRVVAAPTVVEDTVYVGTRVGTLYALDAESGDERWTVDVGRDVEASVAATDDAVYVPGSRTVTALDRSGDEQWTGYVSDGAHAPTVTADAVVVTDRHRIHCFDAADGTERWQRDVRERTVGDQVFGGVRSPPYVHDGTVYVVSHAGDVFALE